MYPRYTDTPIWRDTFYRFLPNVFQKCREVGFQGPRVSVAKYNWIDAFPSVPIEYHVSFDLVVPFSTIYQSSTLSFLGPTSKQSIMPKRPSTLPSSRRRWWLLGVVLVLGLGAHLGHADMLRGPGVEEIADKTTEKTAGKKDRSLQAINTGGVTTGNVTTGNVTTGDVLPSGVAVGMTGMSLSLIHSLTHSLSHPHHFPVPFPVPFLLSSVTGTAQPSAHPTVTIALVPPTAESDATATASTTQPSNAPTQSVPFVQPGDPP